MKRGLFDRFEIQIEMDIGKQIEEYRKTRSELGKGADRMEHGSESRGKFIGTYTASLTKREKEVAIWLHDSYEKIAKGADWKTQESCQVEFDKLPEENRSVMMQLAKRILVPEYAQD